MNEKPTTVTLPVHRGRLRYRDLPVHVEGGNNRAATLVAAGRLGNGESLHWATDQDAYLLPLSLGLHQVVMFAADRGSEHPRFFGVTTDITDTAITLDQYDTAQAAWDAALKAGDQRSEPLPNGDELARLRARVRVLLLDLDPKDATRVLNELADHSNAMPVDVAAAVLNRVLRSLQPEIGETR